MLHYLPEICFQLYGERNFENSSSWKCYGLFQYSAIPKREIRFWSTQAITVHSGIIHHQKGSPRRHCFEDHEWLTKGYGSQSSHIHLYLHIDCSDWPDGFLQNNMLIWIVSKTLSGHTLIFCRRPADGSLPLPVSSPKYISWTSCYAIFSYICWYLTVNI